MASESQSAAGEPGRSVGIDLGTSYSSLALLDDDGLPRVIENTDGSSLTASVVVLADGGRALVDPDESTLSQADPARRVFAIKREMGNPRFTMRHENRRLTPELISSLILTRLRQDAEATIGKIDRAVITVPYYFDESRRRATRNAGRIAGLEVVDIINEPTAATLSYAWLTGELGVGGSADPRLILVYDLGGGTFDVTLVHYTPTHFRVLATDGDTLLGGIDWTDRVVDLVSEQVIERGGSDPRTDPQARFSLMRQCEQVKRDLSERLVTSLEYNSENLSLLIDVTRNECERRTADLLQRTRDTTELVLATAEVRAGQLDEVILVGGSSAMPAVRAMLEQVTGRTPNDQLDPRLAVAQGAAIHAAILDARQVGAGGRTARALVKRLRSISTANVNSHSLGVELTDRNQSERRFNHVMIPKNTPLPCRVTQRFVTNRDKPRAIIIRLLEGEVSDVTACTTIGDFRVVGLPPDLAAGSPVEVEYGYDASGHIHVTARELTGNTEASVEIHWSDGGGDEAVSKFRALSAGYAVE